MRISSRLLRHGVALLSTAALLAAPACSDDASSTDEDVAAVATYNVGLATGFVNYAPQREPLLAAYVASLDAEVVCLQEVWTQAQIDAIIAAAEAQGFSHSYYEFIQHESNGPPSCTVEEAQPMKDCIDEKCPDTPDSELADCATTECSAEFGGLSDDCTTCLASNLGKPRDEIFQICTTGSSEFSWGGHSGILMISKVALTNREHHELDSSLVQRSVLIATAELPSVGTVDVACTHLAADLSETINYNGDFGSFEGEQIHQSEQLLAHLDARSTAGQARIVMGDFNSGPAVAPDIAADLPDAAYKTFIDAGYAGWPAASAAPQCTYCASNLLNDDAGKSVLIDHLFIADLPAGVSVGGTSILGQQTVEITDGNGDVVTTHPSDHYGVRVSFDRTR